MKKGVQRSKMQLGDGLIILATVWHLWTVEQLIFPDCFPLRRREQHPSIGNQAASQPRGRREGRGEREGEGVCISISP